jgi:hypothetical protein
MNSTRRIVASSCVAVLCLAHVATPSRAELRHISSRLFEGISNENMPASYSLFPAHFLAAKGKSVFLIATANSMSFGGSFVGPGTVGARLDDAATSAQWSRVLDPSLNSGTFIYCVAQDNDASVILAGGLRGTMDFGGGPMTSSNQTGDAFIVKLDPGGNVTWQRLCGATFDQNAYGVSVASNGDVLVIGSNFGAIDLGGGNINSSGNADVFVARLRGDTGAHVWSHGYGLAGAQDGFAISEMPDGNVLLLCRLASGGIDFGGGLLTRGGGNMVLVVLDAGGNHVSSRTIGGQAGGTPSDIAVGRDGRIFLCGSFARSMDPGDGSLLISEPTSIITGFVASYASRGEYRWSYALKDSLLSNMLTMGTSNEGGCIVAATKKGTLEHSQGAVRPACFLALEYDSLGTLAGARGFGNPAAYATVFVSTQGDDIFLAGGTNSPIDFGGGELHPVGTDVYLAHLAVRRPARVTIADLTARLRGHDVELRWNIASGEPLAGYYLTRRRNDSSDARIVDSAPAADGTALFVDRDVPPGAHYVYQLTIETVLGDPVAMSVSVDVPAVPTSLAQNSPNPFNPLTTFTYTLAQPAHVSIAIYDLAGALVCKIDQGSQPAGRHQAQWAGHNWSGNPVSSGVYFYRLEGAGEVPARKMILLK